MVICAEVLPAVQQLAVGVVYVEEAELSVGAAAHDVVQVPALQADRKRLRRSFVLILGSSPQHCVAGAAGLVVVEAVVGARLWNSFVTSLG